MNLHVLAQIYIKLELYSDANKEFLFADQVMEHIDFIINIWIGKEGLSELHIFLARTVLQYLCLKDLKNANIFYKTIMSRYTNNLQRLPLVHFLQFLIITCTKEESAKSLFYMLRSKYAVSLAVDPDYSKYLDKIGQIYFNIPAPKSLLSQLFA